MTLDIQRSLRSGMVVGVPREALTGPRIRGSEVVGTVVWVSLTSEVGVAGCIYGLEVAGAVDFECGTKPTYNPSAKPTNKPRTK